jgi:tetratricopeptide (TPR) repeat protein
MSPRLFSLRNHASEQERFHIATEYYGLATIELDKNDENTEVWSRTYPRDALALHRQGANDMWRGRYQEAVEYTLKALALDAHDSSGMANLQTSYRSLDRYQDAEEVTKKFRREFPEVQNTYNGDYLLAFVEGDSAHMEKAVAATNSLPENVEYMASTVADTEAYYGRLARFRDYSDKAVGVGLNSGQHEPAALWQVKKAQWEAELGFSDVARSDAQQSLARAHTRDVRSMAALALARAGDNKRALELADELDREFPERSLIRLYWVATTRAAVELNKDNPERAVALLQAAEAYEASGDTIIQDTTLYPAYVRGEAYLALGDGRKAATEFRKFIDHPGMLANCPLAALARLGVARANALQAKTAAGADADLVRTRALAAYKDFLTLWKDADPDIPIYKQAKAEYARLQ